jgi:hypothetical protein
MVKNTIAKDVVETFLLEREGKKIHPSELNVVQIEFLFKTVPFAQRRMRKIDSQNLPVHNGEKNRQLARAATRVQNPRAKRQLVVQEFGVDSSLRLRNEVVRRLEVFIPRKGTSFVKGPDLFADGVAMIFAH